MALSGDLALAVDDRVRFAFTVGNPTAEPVELEFRDGLAADFAVVRDGAEVWRWSAGRMVTQALWTERLGPGDATTYEARWEDPTPGRYEAVATLLADEVHVEATAPFEV